MFLKGTIIQLRGLEPHDAETLFIWENDRNLWPVSFTQVPFSKFILEEFVNSAHQDIYTNKQLRLMVETTDNKETVGIVDLYEFDPQHARCGIGIYVQDKHRGKGIASDCIKLIKEYCFTTLHLKQVFVHVNQSNVASQGLFEKEGFQKNGLKKCWHKTGINSYEDVWFLQCMNPVD